MLVATRILFLLGIRRIFLLGVDLQMDSDHKYHFEQDRAPGSIRGNNSTYRKINHWFTQLRPLFEAEKLRVYNCNPTSGLKAFDTVQFDAAINMVQEEWGPIDVSSERSSGLYDQEKPKK